MKSNRTIRLSLFTALTLLMTFLLFTLSGCGGPTSDMPFNGDMTFHDVSLHVDDRFVRDSTQSNEDTWIFERGYYKEYVILTHWVSDLNPDSFIPDYADDMRSEGGNAQIKDFLGKDAVFSTYTKDGIFCQDVFFYHNGAYYGISLRGGTEEGFLELISTVTLLHTAEL